MRKYLKLNTLFYKCSLRLRRYESSARELLNNNLQVPTSLLLSIEKLRIQKENVYTDMREMENYFADNIPSKTIEEMLYENKVIKW